MAQAATPMKPYSVERARLDPSTAQSAATPGLEPKTSAILERIADRLDSIEAVLTESRPSPEPVMTPDGEPVLRDDISRDLRIEIIRMVREIGRAKRELVAIKHPMHGENQVDIASRQLDEIVSTTEKATHEIMDSVDAVDAVFKELRARFTDNQDVGALIDEGSERLVRIIEACSFQDLTGQRVTQVVEVLKFIQARILSMIEIWGLEAFADVAADEPEKSEDDTLLNGPALAGQGLSQDDIDALFE